MITTSRPPSAHSSNTDADPFSVLLRPPASETEHERVARLQREADAKRISDSIDEEIKADRERMRKSKQDIRLLLLGQAESGKSTLQKQFQLMYNPSGLDEERLSWRSVIYFNIARPVRRILDALEAFGEGDDDDDLISEAAFASTPDTPTGLPVAADLAEQKSLSPSQASLEKKVAQLRTRLSALLGAEATLADRLSGGVNVSGSGKGSVFVRTGWQSRTLGLAFGKARERTSSGGRFSFTGGRSSMEYKSSDMELQARQAQAEEDKLIAEVASVLTNCQGDVKELWELPEVKKLRDRRRLKLEEWADYFLDNISRVANPGYIPTTEDILHARIQTMGVAEHVFDMSVHGRTVRWHLYDVGGARGQRHSWIPYFDDATAIIFMAPVSAFDQYLDEDPRTNRVDDSLQLFKQICSNPLLKRAHLVLFLNKTDLLRSKLAAGIRVNKYITSYGDRANEYDAVVAYFKAHFTQVHRRNNENNRVLFTHLTSVVDTKAMQSIITDVRDSIFRGYLKSAALV
ncbi:G-protein alpha subunit [Lentinus tigrinus ALCF2SS1-7]|uniref:G-protein alpha subunit n=1 Tax=Lentinus tigrinus ALCF2SS1-6 TaxID=1328759 RepID=A0A5C2SDH5_9APHY|nr:G-protein alpha subunit [Lentinus tigrinus ALCF2SS1-6]RPD75263.1 G-protein alpha subunit [Lentinus tigrinus ALCF2SS1-7]